jgi:small subunit ribosomal protein S16
MSLRIRLRRVGRKKQPSYRLVVADSTTPRDGAYLDTVGYYNPRRQPAELRIDLPKVEQWLGKGASPSETVQSLVRKARKGGDAKVAVIIGVGGGPSAENDAADAASAAAAAEPAE